MSTATDSSIEYARAVYRLDIDERMARDYEHAHDDDMPPPFLGFMFLFAAIALVAATVLLVTRCDLPEPVAYLDTSILQTAINTQCTAGTTEQRLACAIDVAQGHGHGMTPDEYARAKQATALTGGTR